VRLGILSQWYDPEPGPAAIPGIIARALRDLGHDVRVLTGFPNYPTGRLYEGFRQAPGFREQCDGIEVFRVPLIPSHDASAFRRAANYGSFALTAWARSGAFRGVDGLWVYNSPVTVGLPLRRHSRGGRLPYYLQVQDLWPESMTESGMAPTGVVGRVATAAALSAVRRMEREAAAIGLSSPSMSSTISARHPGVRLPFVQSPNPADEALFAPRAKSAAGLPRGWPDGFTVLYAGAVGDVQGLDSVVEAARMLAPDPAIQIVVVGDGIARERLVHAAAGIPNVHFLGRMDQVAVPGIFAAASVNLVSLADRPFLRATTPSKIAALLASEVPILGHLDGDGADLIRSSGAGPVTPPGDAAALAQAIRDLKASTPARLKDMARAGLRYYRAHLSAEAGAERIVERLAGPSPSTGHRADER